MFRTTTQYLSITDPRHKSQLSKMADQKQAKTTFITKKQKQKQNKQTNNRIAKKIPCKYLITLVLLKI